MDTQAKSKIEILLTKERIEAQVTVDEAIGLQEGSIRAARAVIARFIYDPIAKKYVDEAQAVKLVGKLSLFQLRTFLSEFTGSLENELVPLASKETSE